MKMWEWAGSEFRWEWELACKLAAVSECESVLVRGWAYRLAWESV